jgi:hypothetical protein
MAGHKSDVTGVAWLWRRLGNKVAKSPLGPTLRKMSNDKRMMPSFVIVGAMKAGTTFLHRTLALHPQVRDPWRKEIHFFDQNYARGLDWYRAYFPHEEPGCITGEGTPSYMFHPTAAARIMETLPTAKVIAVLRDPTERAISHYRMALSRNAEPLSFQKAIAEEESRIASDREKLLQNPDYRASAYFQFSYRARGLYLPQVQALQRAIPAEQLMILDSRSLFKDSDRVLREVERFLGIDEWTPEKYEAGAVARVEGNIDEETVRGLREFFAPHNDALFEHLGWPGSWNK